MFNLLNKNLNKMKKNILIVGASKGIGRSIFEAIKENEHAITISRNGVDDGAEDYRVDVINDPLPDLEHPLHGLVYCPGTVNLRPFRGLKDSDFKTDFEVNVLGAVRVLQHYLKNLKKAEHASVVLFSTVAVGKGMPFHASIASAKGAVEGLTRSLAAELVPNIRVNAIAPSLTDTSLAEKLLRNDKQREAAAERHPMKRIGTVDDIGQAAVYLLSDQASWITGQIIGIDGGMSAM
jgi:NAD(P)-dependent dehydrogenase (short-subunit alcohol dehydrogenase family)